MIGINLNSIKALNYALWELWIKGNDTNKNIRYAKNICVPRFTEIGKNQNEKYNSAKALIFVKIYKFITN
jgi:hypothetical protein